MKFRFSSVPYIVWSVIFVVVPLILVAVFGLSTSDGQFTFANVAKVSDYTAVFVRSIWLSTTISPCRPNMTCSTRS